MAELTDRLVRTAQPKERQYKLFDSSTRGLHLLVKPNGTKTWRHRQDIAGRERIKTLGHWPDMPLSHARAMAGGIRADEDQTTFRDMFELWEGQRFHDWGPHNRKVIPNRVIRYVLPEIGDRPIATIRASEVRRIIESVRNEGKYETASRLLQYMTQIFSLACVHLDLTFNPAAEAGRLRMSRPPVTHRPAATMDQLGEILAQLEAYPNPTTARALEFLILTAARTGEVRGADWSELSELRGKDPVWHLSAERMKMNRPHAVPLNPQAVDVLLRQAGTDIPRSGLVFPGRTESEPSMMSQNTLIFALYRLGWRGKVTVHGFRSTFSTHASEAGKAPEVIEKALAHIHGNAVRRAYARAAYHQPRRELMNWWGKEVARTKRIATLL